MQKIDAHQHFWNYDPVRDHWITDEMSVLRKTFLPDDIEPLLQQNGVDGCVAVQAGQSEEETNFLVQLATGNSFIKGVVGWVDLQGEKITQRLEHFSQHKIIKGFRHVLQGEVQRDVMLSANFIRGIKALQSFNFTYDILIYPDQLNYTKKLVAQFPGQKFVVDHLAKPSIRKREIKEWQQDMEQLSKHPNVWCKVSGLVTEADWHAWKKDDFTLYLDVVANAFGTERLMFGSDWPVCLLAASYKEVLGIANDYFSSFSNAEQEKIFGGNAVEFYNL